MSYKTWNFRERSVKLRNNGLIWHWGSAVICYTNFQTKKKKQPQASGPYNQFHLYKYYILAFRVAWPQTNKKVIPSKHFHIHVVG